MVPHEDERGLRDPDEYEVDRYRRLAGSFTPKAASALIERRGIRPLIDEANAQIAAAFSPTNPTAYPGFTRHAWPECSRYEEP